MDSSISYGPVANIDDSDSAFAYQIQAGLDVKFTEQLTGFAEYRYVAIDDIDLDRFGGGPGAFRPPARMAILILTLSVWACVTASDQTFKQFSKRPQSGLAGRL
ncbi:outer membrane protein [Aliamphritea spongicola]